MPTQRFIDNPHTLDALDVLSQASTDRTNGLTNPEAQRRLDDFGRNELEVAPGVGIWRRIGSQFSDPLVIILVVAMLIALAAWLYEGASIVPYEPIVIAVILIANAALGLWQEVRADHAVEALQQMTATHASVIRGGEQLTIPSSNLVPGDVLILREGDAVTADARVITSESLQVAEASLTGESVPVSKHTERLGDVVLADRTNMVFNGTVVTAGRGVAVVTNTAMATQMGAIASLLVQSDDPPTPLQLELAHVGRVLGVVVTVLSAIVVGTILLVSGFETFGDVVDVFLVGVSLAVAAIPEGLVAIVSIVLALGVQRMVERNALVKKLSSVETLGSASVICTDKTGTLTRNEMTIERVVTASGMVEITGSGYAPVGDALSNSHPLTDGPLLHEVHMLLRGGSLANDASTRETADGRWEIQGDPTEAAFLVAEQKLGISEIRTRRYHRIAEIPFTSERKMMTTIDADDEEPGVVIVTKGAPDVLMDRCTHEYRAGAEYPLSAQRRDEILSTTDSLADQALRTMAVAYRRTDESDVDLIDEENIEHDLVLVGIAGIIDPPRSEVRNAIVEAARAGIRIVMITGDHPTTASRIAEDLQIASGARTVTGAEIDGLDDDRFDRVVAETSVFARVAPKDKLRIVDSLQRQGHVVAMTGDGVNDAPALRRSDIGVAMGVTGTEVSKQAADMILVDDDFATIVAAVREGRHIFENIRKFLRYLLGSNLGEVLVVFLGVIGAGILGLEAGIDGLAVPLLATQILWINLLTDSGLALALGVDPTIDDLMATPPRRMTDRMINADLGRIVGLTGSTVALSALVALDLELPGGLLGGSGNLTDARTHVFTTIVLAQIFNAFNSRSPTTSAFAQAFSNRWLLIAAAMTLGLQVLVVHAEFLNAAFATAPMSPTDWLTSLLLASAVLWTEEIRKAFARRRLAGEVGS